MKLPYVIGTNEYMKHPTAGIIYQNLGGDLEQMELHEEEMKNLNEDKMNEVEKLVKNAEEKDKLIKANIEYDQAMQQYQMQ